MKTQLARLLTTLIDWAYELVAPDPVLVQVPAVGRIVWFNAASGDTYAAIVAQVDTPGDPRSACSVTVFPPNVAATTKAHAPYNPRGEGWCWPEQGSDLDLEK